MLPHTTRQLLHEADGPGLNGTCISAPSGLCFLVQHALRHGSSTSGLCAFAFTLRSGFGVQDGLPCAGSSTMTVGERLALQQERKEEEERQQMTALQRRQRRRLEYMEVGSCLSAFPAPGARMCTSMTRRTRCWQGPSSASPHTRGNDYTGLDMRKPRSTTVTHELLAMHQPGAMPQRLM